MGGRRDHEAELAAPPARRAWMDLLERDEQSTIYLHPDIARRSELWYYARRQTDGLSALAVLAPKDVSMGLAGLRGRVALRGRKVLADHVLGSGRAGVAERFVADMARLLEAGAMPCLVFEDLEVDSPLWKAVTRAERQRRVRAFMHPSPPQPHWWLRFPDTPARYWHQHGSKTKSTLRRKAKKLGADLVRFTEPEEVPEFLVRAEQVSKRSWQGRRLGTRLTLEEHRGWLTALARRGALRSYILERSGEPLAFLLGVRDAARLRYEEVGFDGAVSKLSPGTVLLYLVIEDLVAEDTPEVLDFGHGHAAYKELFANERTLSGPLVLVNRAWPTAALAIDHAQQVAAQGARRLLQRAGIYDRLRRAYRQGLGSGR